MVDNDGHNELDIVDRLGIKLKLMEFENLEITKGVVRSGKFNNYS